jgi:hypothetical protein
VNERNSSPTDFETAGVKVARITSSEAHAAIEEEDYEEEVYDE